MVDHTILVVIPMYNAAAYVEKAIETILYQTFNNLQVLVIDDGSSDHSCDVVRDRFGDRVLLWQQPNGGPGVAMNRAIRYAYEQGIPFIARMDADDLSMPTRLETQFRLLQENPLAAACSSNCYWIDSDTEQIIGTSTVSSRSPIIKWEIRTGLRGLIQGASLFRTNALTAIGGYRPQFRYAEEVDLFLRLAEKFVLVNAREFLYKIRLNKNSLSLRDPRENLLYHFYALDCARKRQRGMQEQSIETFRLGMHWMLALRIRREELLLQFWRASTEKKNHPLALLAALMDPLRVFARILRRL